MQRKRENNTSAMFSTGLRNLRNLWINIFIHNIDELIIVYYVDKFNNLMFGILNQASNYNAGDDPP